MHQPLLTLHADLGLAIYSEVDFPNFQPDRACHSPLPSCWFAGGCFRLALVLPFQAVKWKLANMSVTFSIPSNCHVIPVQPKHLQWTQHCRVCSPKSACSRRELKVTTTWLLASNMYRQ
jgi:hypothetical protein